MGAPGSGLHVVPVGVVQHLYGTLQIQRQKHDAACAGVARKPANAPRPNTTTSTRNKLRFVMVTSVMDAGRASVGAPPRKVNHKPYR